MLKYTFPHILDSLSFVDIYLMCGDFFLHLGSVHTWQIIAPFNGPFFCCLLNGAKDGLIGLQPILSVFQPVTIYTMLNKKRPVLKY